MAKTNLKATSKAGRTHEGAPASYIHAEQALRRSVLSCLLFEGEFYENGKEISERIKELSENVPPSILANLAIEAREVANLRHVPLLLLTQLAKHGSGSSLVSETIARVIQRADELAELVSLYWKLNPNPNPKKKNKVGAPLSGQMKKGLARAFNKFDAYQLAKYNRDYDVKLRDVMFLTHPKPKDEELFKALAEKTLESPDTWEVSLSGGKDKKETFERLLQEGKLGYLALLRNLRNMEQAGVDRGLIRQALEAGKGADRVLPFRYIAAARHAPSLEADIDAALMKNIAKLPKLKGKTTVLVDVSGSMDYGLSKKSDLKRIDAAAALASVINAEDLEVFTFSQNTVQVPPRRGMAGVDAVIKSQAHGGTYLGQAVLAIGDKIKDRLIVVTDEQSHDRVVWPRNAKVYVINVASAKSGVGYGGSVVHVDGFSENVIRFIYEYEGE